VSAKNDLLAALQPIVDALGELALDDAAAAQRALAARLPLDGAVVRAVVAAAEPGIEQGWLLPKEAGGVRFGRVAKDLGGYSVDVVLSAGAGPRHRHPRGEIDLLIARDGAPRFDGHAPGWAVYAPGSEHVPGVRGGTMLIVYFLPGGAIEWC
jgi:hypothetical protein